MVELAGRLEFAATADFDAGRFAALLRLPSGRVGRTESRLGERFLRPRIRERVLHHRHQSCGLAGNAGLCQGVSPGESVYLTRKLKLPKLPSDEASKPVPGPEEMEAGAELKAEVLTGERARGRGTIQSLCRVSR